MPKLVQTTSVALLVSFLLLAECANAQNAVLFNGKDLEGWSFRVDEDEPTDKVGDVWVVRQGLLVSTGAASGYLLHKGEFENYVLTLDWRFMRINGSGMAVSGGGSVYIHTTDEPGRFGAPKSIEVPIDQVGSVFFRDVELRADVKTWAFRAPEFADDVEREMGEWNQLKLICNGKRLTVIVNGTAVNQVEGLNRTKGAIAIKSQRSMIQAPTFYRNIRVQPIAAAALQEEKNATGQLAKYKAQLAQKRAAEEAKLRKEEQQKQAKKEKLAKQLSEVEVTGKVAFKAEARHLPFPKDAKKLEFDATFGDIEFESKSSLQTLLKFYNTEMAKRGWQVAESDLDDDSVEITFEHGEAEVELTLDGDSDEVEVDMECEGLSFEGTNDPAGLVAVGVPQPKAYLFLQREIQLPQKYHSLEFEDGDSCLFKSGLKLQEAFDFLGNQLRKKGYRETRRPIVTGDRRYTEFAKGGVEISVNIFTDGAGTRNIVEYEE